jgi:hypothetical protein
MLMRDLSGAYLAMLEQTIYLMMIEIAEQYPEPYRQRYLDSTAKFALPYCESAITMVSHGLHESDILQGTLLYRVDESQIDMATRSSSAECL